MIEADKRKAIYLLHQEGMSAREIARRLHVCRRTIKTVIEQCGQMPAKTQFPKNQIEPELLQRVYTQCDGWIQRMHEKLTEEEWVSIKYSTLTRLLRESGITNNKSRQQRCSQVPDEPGAEMQHDTTLYHLKIGQQKVKVVASILYLRYSKRRYLKFYRTFDRFKMKCFLHEALLHWGYTPRQCIIDNTNLARLRGTGRNAVIVPEMEAFARQYGFEFRCHEKGHADRKAGEERSFWTAETNFIPGRDFLSLEDLNQQAFEWACVRLEHRPQGEANIIPAKSFEHERIYLNKLSSHLPAPYQVLARGTDQYGYIAYDGNYYWVPGTKRDDVQVLRYGDHLKIYLDRELLAEYPLPPDGVKNSKLPVNPPVQLHEPSNRKSRTLEEEQQLRAIAPEVGAYLDFALQGVPRHSFLRRLLALSRRMTSQLFVQSIARAHRYRITSLETIERIALRHFNQGELPFAEVDESFRDRQTYLEGAQTEPPDLSIYSSNEPEPPAITG